LEVPLLINSHVTQQLSHGICRVTCIDSQHK